MVGDSERGEFVVLPAIAGVVLDGIGSGLSLGEVGALARDAAGEDIDIVDFANALVDLGFVTHVNDVALEITEPRMHDGGLVGARLAAIGRPLFSATAWVVYAALGLACGAILLLKPQYRPPARSLFFLHNPLESVALLLLINSVLMVGHEGAHWLGARVEGAPARISLGRRLYLLVAETDLTSLLALPRRRRFGALLAGLAFEITMLALLLAAEIAINHRLWEPSATISRLIAALVLLRLTGIVFQFFVFLRTDLYAVLVIGLDCLQLTRTTQLMIRRSVGRLSPDEAEELASADARDLEVARRYRWLYVMGLAAAAWYLVTYAIPWTGTLTGWIASGLWDSGPSRWRFWESLGFAPLVLGPLVLPAAMIIRERFRRQ